VGGAQTETGREPATVTADGQTTTFVDDGNPTPLALRGLRGTLVKKAVADGQTTVYVGPHYEKNVSTGQETRYYFFGAQRVAMRQAGVVY
jgi:hypothetical protein